MKLSKTSWIILSVGVFLVVVAGLGLTRSQQIKEQGQLDTELDVAEMRISKLGVEQLHEQQDSLQQKLDDILVELTAAKSELSHSVESIDVTDEFYAIAESCSVMIENISSSTIQNEELDGIACSKTSLNAMASGDVPDLISFIIKLNTDFTTGTVKLAQISIEDPDEDRPSSADIQMVVYTYEGD